MNRPKPLSDIVVADFSRVLAGPLAATMFADLGATVIKVEKPEDGDDTRAWGPPWTENSSAYFHSANRSKRSIELDLRDRDDLDLARRLALRSDVLIENFRDGILTRHGLGYEQLRASNPGLVYVSITGFGSKQGASLPGYDFLVQAVGGLMSVTGHGGEPTKVGVALVDVLTSKDAVVGTLAALRERDRSGFGQRVEVNLLSSLLASMANQTSAYLATGTSPSAMGNQHPSIAPYETLRAKDGYLAVCAGNDAQFARLAGALGLPDLVDDPDFVTNGQRVMNRSALVARLEAALATDTVDAWAQSLAFVGVSAGKVGSVGDGIDLARRLGLHPTVPMPDAPDQIRNPISFSETPVDLYFAPPRLGQHNEDVRQWLTEEETK